MEEFIAENTQKAIDSSVDIEGRLIAQTDELKGKKVEQNIFIVNDDVISVPA